MNKIKLRYISDLHLDIKKTNSREHFLYQKNDNTILAIAGDLCNYNPKLTKNFFDSVHKNFYKILFVPGNHEYINYKNINIDTINRNLFNICNTYDNVHFLNNNTIRVNNINFAGTTLWSSPKWYRYGTIYENSLPITEDNIRCWNRTSINFIKEQLTVDNTIIITHHSPLKNTLKYNVTHNKYNNDPSIDMFCNELEHIIKPPIKVWIFGHTHYQTKFILNNVIVASYPRFSLNSSNSTNLIDL